MKDALSFLRAAYMLEHKSCTVPYRTALHCMCGLLPGRYGRTDGCCWHKRSGGRGDQGRHGGDHNSGRLHFVSQSRNMAKNQMPNQKLQRLLRCRVCCCRLWRGSEERESEKRTVRQRERGGGEEEKKDEDRD